MKDGKTGKQQILYYFGTSSDLTSIELIDALVLVRK